MGSHPADVVVGGGEQSAKSIPDSIHSTVSPDNTNVETEIEMVNNRPTPDRVEFDEGSTQTVTTNIGSGDVLIAAITSCTNTSNPAVMIAAGIVLRKRSKGMKGPAYVKTSLAPGSRVVTEYLDRTGLSPYLDKVGFNLVGYGCTTLYRKLGTFECCDRG